MENIISFHKLESPSILPIRIEKRYENIRNIVIFVT